VTEGMQICLPTTCKLLGIPRHIGQAAKAALLRKEEAATKVLSTVAKRKYPASNFYWHFSNNFTVPVLSTCPKARRIVMAVNGHIITLSEDSLKAADDISQYHFPVTFGGTNIIYGFSSGMPAWHASEADESLILVRFALF